MRESKEKIKNRMLKNASRTWGYHDTESESAFDPLVGMLMGALAFELEQISGEIHNSESRVVEKLVQLLTPEPVVGAHPAHGVLTSQPHQPTFEVLPSNQFYLSRKVKNAIDPTRTEQQNVFFTPAGRYKLFNGKVKYIATERTLFEIDKEGYKDAVSESVASLARANQKVWIGLEFGSDPESLEGLSLFFDLRSELHEDAFYPAVSRAKWFLNDKPVQFIPGYGGKNNLLGKDEEALLALDWDTSENVCNHINRLYSKKFMTLTGNPALKDCPIRDNYPPSLGTVFNEQALRAIKTSCVWIRMDFSQPLPADVMENIFCSMNSFPVLNRQLNKFTYSAKEQINVIPLKSENAFFDMKSVSNTKGNTYRLKAFSRVKEIEKGSYILRQGGVGRFDSRNALEILTYLIELLRDENAAFTLLGTDMISSNLKELNQIIARLEQRVADRTLLEESVSYLLLKSLPADETVYVEFWTTNGATGNNIKPGTPLVVFSGSDFRPETIRFLTPTMGGREKMDTEDRLHAYRRALLSKDRVVTAEDIKALCFEYFGKMISDVTVRKGLMVGTTTDAGLTRTIDMHISLAAQGAGYSAEEIAFLKEDLKTKLEEKSMNILPYRVFFQ
ncbi:MAG: hypothetical protein WCJ26_02235 [bacterium]